MPPNAAPVWLRVGYSLLTTATFAANGGTVAVLSEARVMPLWTITIAGAGTGPLTLTNTTTGEAATLLPPFGAAGFTAG